MSQLFHSKRNKGKLIGLDDFEIISIIGKGGFAQVWRVREKETSKIYAMKVMLKSSLKTEGYIDHVNREREIMLELSGLPFIIKLYYSFQTDTHVYLVMNFVGGGSLYSYVSTLKDPLSEKDAQFYLGQILIAIQAMHERGIAYRDLKLENILLDSNGYIRLSDFGLSASVKTEKCKSFSGTGLYLAPEVLLGEGHGTSVDFWALGILTFMLLTLVPPFFDENVKELFRQIVKTEVDYSEFPHISPHARSFIDSLLVKDPEKRAGCGKASTAEDLKSHPFFQGLDWKKLAHKKLKAPFKPKIDLGQELSTDEIASVWQQGEKIDVDQFRGFSFVASHTTFSQTAEAPLLRDSISETLSKRSATKEKDRVFVEFALDFKQADGLKEKYSGDQFYIKWSCQSKKVEDGQTNAAICVNKSVSWSSLQGGESCARFTTTMYRDQRTHTFDDRDLILSLRKKSSKKSFGSVKLNLANFAEHLSNQTQIFALGESVTLTCVCSAYWRLFNHLELVELSEDGTPSALSSESSIGSDSFLQLGSRRFQLIEPSSEDSKKLVRSNSSRSLRKTNSNRSLKRMSLNLGATIGGGKGSKISSQKVSSEQTADEFSESELDFSMDEDSSSEQHSKPDSVKKKRRHSISLKKISSHSSKHLKKFGQRSSSNSGVPQALDSSEESEGSETSSPNSGKRAITRVKRSNSALNATKAIATSLESVSGDISQLPFKKRKGLNTIRVAFRLQVVKATVLPSSCEKKQLQVTWRRGGKSSSSGSSSLVPCVDQECQFDTPIEIRCAIYQNQQPPFSFEEKNIIFGLKLQKSSKQSHHEGGKSSSFAKGLFNLAHFSADGSEHIRDVELKHSKGKPILLRVHCKTEWESINGEPLGEKSTSKESSTSGNRLTRVLSLKSWKKAVGIDSQDSPPTLAAPSPDDGEESWKIYKFYKNLERINKQLTERLEQFEQSSGSSGSSLNRDENHPETRSVLENPSAISVDLIELQKQLELARERTDQLNESLDASRSDLKRKTDELSSLEEKFNLLQKQQQRESNDHQSDDCSRKLDDELQEMKNQLKELQESSQREKSQLEEELTSLRSQLQKSKRKLHSQKNTLLVLKSESESREKASSEELSQMKSSFEELSQAKSSLDRSLNDLQTQFSSLKEENSQLLVQIQSPPSSTKSSRGKSEKSSKKSSRKPSSEKQKAEDDSSGQEKWKKLEEELQSEKSKSSNLEQKLSELNQLVDSLRLKSSEVEGQVSVLTLKLEEESSRFVSSEKSLSESQSQLVESQRKYIELESQISLLQLEKSLDLEQDPNKSVDREELFETNSSKLQEENENLTQEIETLREETHSLRKELSSQNKKHQEALEALQSECDSKSELISQLQSELENLSMKMKTQSLSPVSNGNSHSEEENISKSDQSGDGPNLERKFQESPRYNKDESLLELEVLKSEQELLKGEKRVFEFLLEKIFNSGEEFIKGGKPRAIISCLEFCRTEVGQSSSLIGGGLGLPLKWVWKAIRANISRKNNSLYSVGYWYSSAITFHQTLKTDPLFASLLQQPSTSTEKGASKNRFKSHSSDSDSTSTDSDSESDSDSLNLSESDEGSDVSGENNLFQLLRKEIQETIETGKEIFIAKLCQSVKQACVNAFLLDRTVLFALASESKASKVFHKDQAMTEFLLGLSEVVETTRSLHFPEEIFHDLVLSLFEYVNALVFNEILTHSEKCCAETGFNAKLALSNLLLWTKENRNLWDESEEFLQEIHLKLLPLSQVTDALVVLPNGSLESVPGQQILDMFSALSIPQLRQLIRHFSTTRNSPETISKSISSAIDRLSWDVDEDDSSVLFDFPFPLKYCVD